MAGGLKIARRLPNPALFERRRDTQQPDFDSVLVGPPPSSGKLGAQSFNLDTQPLRGRVSWFGWRRGAQLRREPAVHFVRGSERESAGVTTAVAARYRGGPGR
jgi:hypothetical protein